MSIGIGNQVVERDGDPHAGLARTQHGTVVPIDADSHQVGEDIECELVVRPVVFDDFE